MIICVLTSYIREMHRLICHSNERTVNVLIFDMGTLYALPKHNGQEYQRYERFYIQGLSIISDNGLDFVTFN